MCIDHICGYRIIIHFNEVPTSYTNIYIYPNY